jgi:type II secretory pathway component GspD/PulD (secretin)
MPQMNMFTRGARGDEQSRTRRFSPDPWDPANPPRAGIWDIHGQRLPPDGAVDREIFARIEHILANDSLMRSFWMDILNVEAAHPDLLGGTALAFSVVSDAAAEAILRMVRKDRTGKELIAPKIMAYNGQRANVFVAQQITYIRDYDVEVAEQAAIADPIPGVVQDGIVLDVRPTISADRKYITMELRPTVARLKYPITADESQITTYLGTHTATGEPIIVQIETPWLIVERLRATITVPDGGTLLVGGLTNVFDEDIKSEIPFLARIPLLNFLVSRKAKGKHRQCLLILMKAGITAVEEEERRFMETW